MRSLNLTRHNAPPPPDVVTAVAAVAMADVADVEVATADVAAVVDDDQNTEQKRT
jgi:hypothetical protein